MDIGGPHGRNRRPTFAAILGEHLAVILLAILILLGIQIAAPVRAQGMAEAYYGGDLLLSSAAGAVQPALQLRTDYNILTERGMRRVWLRQTFRNESTELQQGLYLFELPRDSRVRVMRIVMDGEEVMSGRPAQSLLQRGLARRERGRAESVSFPADFQGVIYQEVLGIPPAEAITIELVYEQALEAGASLRAVDLPLPLPRFRLLGNLGL